MTATILLALLFGASAALCHLIAKQRGSDPVFWTVMGVIFGPLAIVFVLFSKSREKK